MTPSTPTLRAAHAALLDWWELAGIEVDPALRRTPTADPRASPPARPAAPQALASGARAAPRPVDALEQARAAAATATSLESLKAAIEAFDGCGLKRTARSTVVFDGVPGAPVLLVGEAPGREEDEAGLPFVGQSGQFLDTMLGSIGLSRRDNLCITNAVYWRPPGNRTPSRDELAICAPFLVRFIELSAPRFLILAGGVAAQSVLDTSLGILKLRGSLRSWSPPSGGAAIPAIATLHPAYLFRTPSAKAMAWKDLLTIEDQIRPLGLGRSGNASQLAPQ
jgi:uracil-DNA glycosylase